SDGPVVMFSKGQYFIDTVCHLSQRITNGTQIFVAIDYHAVLEFEPMCNGFAHQPLERNLSEQVVLITATDIRMSSYEPTLLDVVKIAGRVSLPLFRSALHPKCGSECLPMLVYGQCMVGMRIVDPQVCFQESEVFTTDIRDT